MQASLKKKEDLTDVEQQFILRLPATVAASLREDISSTTVSIKDKLSLEVHLDTQKGKVIYDGHVYNAKLVDLPCIIESLKTTDKKTFYKTADIAQMLICNMEEDSEAVLADESLKTGKSKEKESLWNHGICPPFKNVRKRRFRKTLQKKVQDQPDVEKELRRLFSMDQQAIDVKWQVVTENEKSNEVESKVKSFKGESKEVAQTIKTRDIFGDVSSSSDDENTSELMAVDDIPKMVVKENSKSVTKDNNFVAEDNSLNLVAKDNSKSVSKDNSKLVIEENSLNLVARDDSKSVAKDNKSKLVVEDNSLMLVARDDPKLVAEDLQTSHLATDIELDAQNIKLDSFY